MSLRTLATKIGISPIYMSDIENGKRSVPIKQKYELIDKIIKILDIPNEQRSFVIKMAICTHEYLEKISEYLPENDLVREFIREVIIADLTDDEWADLQQQLHEKVKNKKLQKKY